MNELFESITAAPAITVLCLLAAQGYKSVAPERMYRHIPVICGLLGLVLGIACHLHVPGYLPAENIVSAGAVGAASGWAATGIHQAKKQYGEGEEGSCSRD